MEQKYLAFLPGLQNGTSGSGMAFRSFVLSVPYEVITPRILVSKFNKSYNAKIKIDR